MRILFVSTVPGWGGSEFLWSLMAEEALKAGHAVDVVVSSQMDGEQSIKRLEKSGAIIHFRKDPVRNDLKSKMEFLSIKKLPRLFGHYRKIKFGKIDSIVISQGGSYESCFDLDL